MAWTLICGTWKNRDETVLREVRQTVRDELAAGNSILTGGALGVDLTAAEEALRRFPDGSRLRIMVPAPFRAYCEHYRLLAEEGIISDLQAEELVNVLEALRKVAPDNLYELTYSPIDDAAFLACNTEVVGMADSVIAFSIANSSGTADMLAKAATRNIPIVKREYAAK